MIAIDDDTTIGQAFFAACERYAGHSLLAVPANPARSYDPAGREILYSDAATEVRKLMTAYRSAGYGLGHRVGLFLESRPEHLLHKLALNALGVCCVPINPDHRPRELAYVVDHARLDLIVALNSRADAVREEEVLACVVLKDRDGHETPEVARALFDFCHQQLAYYKAPGWLWFAAEIPTTGTQKIQKHRIFPEGADPRALPGMHDLRSFKKRH